MKRDAAVGGRHKRHRHRRCGKFSIAELEVDWTSSNTKAHHGPCVRLKPDKLPRATAYEALCEFGVSGPGGLGPSRPARGARASCWRSEARIRAGVWRPTGDFRSVARWLASDLGAFLEPSRSHDRLAGLRLLAGLFPSGNPRNDRHLHLGAAVGGVPGRAGAGDQEVRNGGRSQRCRAGHPAEPRPSERAGSQSLVGNHRTGHR